MDEETNDVPSRALEPRSLDAADRTILAALAEDAGQSYAALGKLVHLSPPAVHERVRKLKAARVIESVTADLNGAALGRPLLAFVEVTQRGWGKTPEMLSLRDLPEVEEIHSVTGDAGVLLKVRAADAMALEELLHRIYDIEGVQGTRSTVVLRTYLERGPLP